MKVIDRYILLQKGLCGLLWLIPTRRKLVRLSSAADEEEQHNCCKEDHGVKHFVWISVNAAQSGKL